MSGGWVDVTGPPIAASATGWRDRARDFAAREIVPRVEEMERSDRFPPGLLRRLADEGFLGLSIPSSYGGAAASAEDTVAVLSEFGRVSAVVATLLSVHLSVASMPIVTWGTEAQKSRFLPSLARGSSLGGFALTEAGAGSDAAAISCRYRRSATGFRLDGTKMFITNGDLADLLVTFATVDPGRGVHGISAFLLEKGARGFSVAQRLEKLGLRGSETTELVYDGVDLPVDALLGSEGQGLTIALKALTDGRVGIAAVALGVAQAALEELLRIGRQHPGEGSRIAAARGFTEVTAAEALVLRAARLKDSGAPFVREASAAKLFASQAAVRTAEAAVDLAGPEAGNLAHPASRLLRDARVFSIVEGTSEIQELVLGRSLLGR